MSWENFPINVWHQCNVKIHFGVVGVCWSNRQDGKSNKSHCWSWMRLRSMMVRTVDISLMLFIIHHPTICSQVPRPARTYVSIVSYRSNTPSSKNNLTSWLNNHWVSQHMTLESRSGGRIKFCFVFFLALRRSTPGLTESPLSLFARFAFHWCWPFCDKRSSCDSFKKRQHRLILEGWYQIKFFLASTNNRSGK